MAKADPVLTQELKGARVPTAIPTVSSVPFQSAAEWLGFMSRTASTSFTLPLVMMRCRTPLETWGEQNKLLQDLFADFREVPSARALDNARGMKVKKRRQADAP